MEQQGEKTKYMSKYQDKEWEKITITGTGGL